MIEFIALAQQCAPAIEMPIAHAIVKRESNYKAFAIGVNYGGKPIAQPKNYNEAVTKAKYLIQKGFNIDLGLAQINSKNLNWLNLRVEDAFNPCANLKAMQTVYLDCFKRAGEGGLGTRMQRAFSCYNTGNFNKGFKNGYVNKTTSYFNEFFGINRKSLPIKSEDLAVYASSLNNQDSKDISEESNIKNESINMNELEEENKKVYSSWDVFKDF